MRGKKPPARSFCARAFQLYGRLCALDAGDVCVDGLRIVEAADGVRLVLDAVIFAELFDRLFDDDVAGEALHVPLHGAVVGEEAEIVGQVLNGVERL